MIRVLIVDDSALMRQLLTKILSKDPEIEVVGAAQDPLVARDKIKALHPDVLTLDVEMPRMDGLSFLEKIMRLRPMPVVMVSSLTQRSADVTLQALEIGAVDFVAKPMIDLQQGMEVVGAELVAKVKAAARARVSARTAPACCKPAVRPLASYRTTDTIVAIGASTGGVEALREVISVLPADSPPILIAQHMPEQFTKRFAERLDSLSHVTVREAEHGIRVIPGHAYIAPGNRHLELARSGGEYRCALNDGPLMSGHRPSVDILFKSVAIAAGANAVGVILTGMGKDGAEGLKAVRVAGAATLGQDEATSLVYGMPRVAKEIGAVVHELPLGAIAGEILRLCQQTGRPMGSAKSSESQAGNSQFHTSRPS